MSKEIKLSDREMLHYVLGYVQGMPGDDNKHLRLVLRGYFGGDTFRDGRLFSPEDDAAVQLGLSQDG